MKQNLNQKLNYFAEFKDKSLETEYLQKYIDSFRKNVGILMMIMGALYFATAFSIVISEEQQQIFIIDLCIRAILLLVAILSGLFLMKRKRYNGTFLLIIGFVIFAVLAYQFIIYIYDGQAFLRQGLTYLLIICAIFWLPNRWIYAVCLSIGIVVLFFVVTPFHIQNVPFADGITIFAAFVATITLGNINSYNLNKHRRLQFLRERELEVISSSDYLTGTYNRKKFDEVFLKLLNLLENEDSCFSIIMFDLDDFKCLNDTHGHMLGDKVLSACADTVLMGIRNQEILARWGGEEFMILLPHTTLKEATILAERLRIRIEELIIGDEIRITASFGVTDCKKGDTTDSILSRVDTHLYNAKQMGKNCTSA